MIYSLTNKGMEQFPQRYLQLTLRLLEQLKTSLPEKVLGNIFREVAEGIADDLTQDIDLEKLGLKERLELLQEVLISEGFMVNLEEDESNFYIVEASCPYHHVGEDHPEICVIDMELIAHFAASSPERIECILDGDKQCKYMIKRN